MRERCERLASHRLIRDAVLEATDRLPGELVGHLISHDIAVGRDPQDFHLGIEYLLIGAQVEAAVMPAPSS